MNAESNTAHEQNKREMFDRMRAYHQSELAHKGDAINMLRSVFTGTIGAYAAVVGAIVTPGIELTELAIFEIIWLAFIIISIVSLSISISTNIKIDKDHIIYDSSLKEYARESEFLGLRDSFIWHDNQPKYIKPIPIDVNSGKGYRYTQNIISIFTSGIIALAYLFTYIILNFIE